MIIGDGSMQMELGDGKIYGKVSPLFFRKCDRNNETGLYLVAEVAADHDGDETTVSMGQSCVPQDSLYYGFSKPDDEAGLELPIDYGVGQYMECDAVLTDSDVVQSNLITEHSLRSWQFVYGPGGLDINNCFKESGSSLDQNCFNGFGDRVGMVTEATACLNLVPKRYIWPNIGVSQVGYDMDDFQDTLNDYFTEEQDRLCRVALNPSDITQDVHDTSNGNRVCDDHSSPVGLKLDENVTGLGRDYTSRIDSVFGGREWDEIVDAEIRARVHKVHMQAIEHPRNLDVCSKCHDSLLNCVCGSVRGIGDSGFQFEMLKVNAAKVYSSAEAVRMSDTAKTMYRGHGLPEMGRDICPKRFQNDKMVQDAECEQCQASPFELARHHLRHKEILEQQKKNQSEALDDENHGWKRLELYDTMNLAETLCLGFGVCLCLGFYQLSQKCAGQLNKGANLPSLDEEVPYEGKEDPI